ncbi:T9SS type A sorting domain-containing protein [Flavobacterium sp.]|uniref:T9SS type A sorting domain-containing protein n=1 Tax=Flavobacterium sp. TaxID=239 RepID=UPI0012041BDB|nr:T9SS type A sorting domain-containing protein [Flavobacterium sp.]RZJ70624.1 MAG: T9SS type A sorting domain-containing protein [Flavobacterium sp.]
MKKTFTLLLSAICLQLFSQTYTITVYNTQNSGIASNNIQDFKLKNGTMWIVTNAGLTKMVGTTFTNYNNVPVGSDPLNKVAIGTNNNVFMSTYATGFIKYNGSAFTTYTTSNSQLPNNSINDMATDSAGNLWLACPNGLVKFNGTTFTTYMSGAQVNSLGIDQSDNVYFAINGMLRKINANGAIADVTDGVYKILRATTSGIYISTGDGLGKIVGNQYEYLHWMGGNSCLADCGLSTADVDNTGDLWLGLMPNCANGGVQRFTDCITYSPQNSALPNPHITSIDATSSTTVWAGTQEGGLVKFSTNLEAEDFEAKTFSVFPNPAKNSFQIENSQDIVSISFYDIRGVVVKTITSEFDNSIDVSGLGSGIYLLQAATADGKFFAKRFVKE